MGNYTTWNVDPEVSERLMELIQERYTVENKTEAMRRLVDMLEADDSAQTVSLEAADIERIGDEVEG